MALTLKGFVLELFSDLHYSSRAWAELPRKINYPITLWVSRKPAETREGESGHWQENHVSGWDGRLVSANFPTSQQVAGPAKHFFFFFSRSLWPIGVLREAVNRGLNMWFYEYLHFFLGSCSFQVYSQPRRRWSGMKDSSTWMGSGLHFAAFMSRGPERSWVIHLSRQIQLLHIIEL